MGDDGVDDVLEPAFGFYKGNGNLIGVDWVGKLFMIIK